ncbi:MAG: hypothetical protein KKA73_26935 [Chloroflexi bacterium]|nr:hypothetical protein [Chloroflexota bacterium]MBU1751336.1 hypothetical protein [Chloroflexota bacterium]
MRTTTLYLAIILLLLAVLAGASTACTNSCGPAPTPAPTYTPWVVVVTATRTPQGPTPPPTRSVPWTATLEPGQPTPTNTPLPLPTITPSPTPKCPPEPNKPVIQVLSPANGAQVASGQLIQIQSQTGDDCSIMAVDFYDNGGLYNRVDFPNRPPFVRLTQQWSSTAVGQHTLSVVAHDTRGNSSPPSSITLDVYQVQTQPTVRIDYPTERIVVQSGQDVQIKCAASSQAQIARLDLIERKGNQEVVYTYDGTVHDAPYYWEPWWRSHEVGDHTLFVRATDVNGGVGQSKDLVVGVADDNPPAVQPSYSSDSLAEDDTLTVHVNAADSKGIVSLRLLVDGQERDAWNAPNPSVGKSHVSVDLYWRGAGPARRSPYNVHVYANDSVGKDTTTPDQPVSVYGGQPPTPTFTPVPPPTETPTPPPPPPNAEIKQPVNGFSVQLPQSVHFKVKATSSSGLARIELWGYYQGQPQHQLYNTWPAQANQLQLEGTYDWVPPSAGVVFFYVRAHDQAGQTGDSPTISGYIEPETATSQLPQHPGAGMGVADLQVPAGGAAITVPGVAAPGSVDPGAGSPALLVALVLLGSMTAVGVAALFWRRRAG